MNFTTKHLKEMRKMAKKLPASRFYTMCALAGFALSAFVIHAIAALIQALK